MTEPAELLLIEDRYDSALRSLSRGRAAEEAGERAEALVLYRKARQHLAQGLEVPTGGEKRLGADWDRARQLQRKMRESLGTVNTQLSDLETNQLTKGWQRVRLLVNFPPNLYPALPPSSHPLQSSLHRMYPTLPAATQNTTPTAPPRPPPPAVPHALPAASPGTLGMANSGDQPPAYTPRPTVGHRILSFGQAGAGLGPGRRTGAAAAGDGNELLFISSGVQMFFVAPNGQVSSLTYPGYLRIITFDSQHKDATAGGPSTFLHVCDWLYPLTAATPVLLANSGIFMFPDTLSETPGSYVGIVLSSELPAKHRETFQDLLSQTADLRVQGPEGEGSEVIDLSEKIPLGPMKEHEGLTLPTGEKDKPPLPGWSEKVAQGILTGATHLSVGLVKGAEATGRAIHKGAAKIRDHITPEETPSEVSPRVTKGLQATKQATGGAVWVSQFLVNGVSTVVGHVADKMAPHIKKQGAKLVPESMKKNKDSGPSNWDGAKFVAISSVQGLSTVWSSLESGAKLVGKSVTAETVTTVTYKYGNDTGAATDTALKSVINIGVTAYNIDHLIINGLLKAAEKKSATATPITTTPITVTPITATPITATPITATPITATPITPEGQPAQTEGKEAQKREHQLETHGKEKQKKRETEK